ncbi:hypothetical protein EZV62_024672 [Acer yangbiense]|uniref:Retrotransposon gag domain-containing protein n=1 Tax=Acer yangbiense TaxID=1000413 RepID=A0A5C7GWB4_9ROSI|nr:hypothetical protein EZV62_024672 [Acer yangbiense]
MRNRQGRGMTTYPEPETELNALAGTEAFRALQEQLADIQEQIHMSHHRHTSNRESPFTEDVTSVSVPDNFRMPRKDMCGFAGTGDPEDHLDTYLDWMNMQGASDAVKCRIFPLTLSGDARTWYGNLKRQSISSFHELSKEFRSSFAASRRRCRHMVHLNSIRQTPSETTRDYMKRFNEAARQVQGFNEVGAVMAFSQGLLQGKLSWSLSKRGQSTYRELMERAEKYATAEDISQTKAEDTHSEAQRSPEKQRRWFKTSTDRGKDRQAFRQELIRAGKLREYVKQGDLVPDQPRDKGPMRGKAHCDDPDSDNDEHINFILTESVVGDSSSTSFGERSSSICFTTTPEDHPGTWDPISFSPSDSTGVRYPHCDALIISVKIRNRTVKRTLIDHGSSLDIIHWDLLQMLGYTVQQLQASRYCIRGIGGHRTRPVGQIDLPVRFGTRPCIRTLDLRLMGKVNRLKRRPFGSDTEGNRSESMLLEEIRVTSLDPRKIREHNSQADALAKLASTSDMKLPRIVTVFRLLESSITKEPVAHVVIPEHASDTDTWMAPIVRFLRYGILPDEKNASLRVWR